MHHKLTQTTTSLVTLLQQRAYGQVTDRLMVNGTDISTLGADFNSKSSNSYLYAPNTAPESFGCGPLSEADAKNQLRFHEDVYKAAISEHDKAGVVKLIPFFDITRGRHDLHSGHWADCTHYCQNAPLLWAPVWDKAVSYYKEFAGLSS